jgi:hypothetical protein
MKKKKMKKIEKYLNIANAGITALGIIRGVALPILFVTTAITFATDLFFHENIHNAAQKAAKTFITGSIGVAAMTVVSY